jgi:hypothetical protein
MKNSERIKNRLIQCVEEGELTFGHSIEIIEYLVNKVNLVSQADYARVHNISRVAVGKRVKSGKETTIKIGKTDYIIL